MKRQHVVWVLLVLVLLIPATIYAATFSYTQGFGARKGAGTVTTLWQADVNGLLRTRTDVQRVPGTGINKISEGWAEALACKTIARPQPGTYRVTGVVPLNGKVITERYWIGTSAATAKVYTVLKIWQGAWPGTAGHKFMNQIMSVSTNAGSTGRKETLVRGTYTHVQYYTITNSADLKVCVGRQSYSWAKTYARAQSYFWDTYVSNPNVAVSVERLP